MSTYDEGKLLMKIKILLDDVVATQFDEKLDDKIGKLPTKEEFYEQVDKLMKELKDSREEQVMLSQHDADQQDQIDLLKNIHPDYTHVAFAS